MTWPGGKVFDSTWTKKTTATFPIGRGQVISGWDKGLVGKTVGSQILLVIPPDEGYGAEGKTEAGIKAPTRSSSSSTSSTRRTPRNPPRFEPWAELKQAYAP